jgi:hypothetical protein
MFIKRKISLLLGMAAVFPLMAHSGNNTMACVPSSDISAALKNTSFFKDGLNFNGPFSVDALESENDTADAINKVFGADVLFTGVGFVGRALLVRPEDTDLKAAVRTADAASDRILATTAGKVDYLKKMMRKIPSDKEKLKQYIVDIDGNASVLHIIGKTLNDRLGCKNGTNPVTAKLCFHAPKFEAAAQEVIDALKPFDVKDICEAKKPWYERLFSKGAA